jgi:hypothetical protein
VLDKDYIKYTMLAIDDLSNTKKMFKKIFLLFKKVKDILNM